MNGIDMDMQLLQNTSIPLGNLPEISIESLLGDGESMSSAFNVDDNGNLSLSLFNGSMAESFVMPAMSFDGDGGIEATSAHIGFDIDYGYTEIPGKTLADLLISQTGSDRLYYVSGGVTQDPDVAELRTEVGIEVDKELPAEILSIRSVDMNATMQFKFSTSRGTYIHVAEGLTIQFPSYMVLSAKSENVNYKVIDNNKVVFLKDTEVSYYSPFLLDLSFDRIQNIDQMVRTVKGVNYVTSKDEVKISGKLFIKASDYGNSYIPTNPQLDFQLNLTDLEMTSAEVVINMDLELEDMNIEIGELPEMFSGEGTVMDLYNPILRFKIDNASPLELNLNGEMTAYGATTTTDIHVGNECPYGNAVTAPIVIPGNDVAEYYFSRQGTHETQDGQDICLDKLGNILKEIPESVSIHDIRVNSSRDFIEINAYQEYNVNMEYELYSPLAFGKDLNISFNYDIDLGLSGDAYGLESLKIAMNMINTIPMNFAIKGIALDSEGNQLKDTDVDLDINLRAGTLEKPVESPVEIHLETRKSEINVQKLRLILTATSNQNFEGKVLNKSQGLTITGLNITLPDGIKMDLTETNN